MSLVSRWPGHPVSHLRMGTRRAASAAFAVVLLGLTACGGSTSSTPSSATTAASGSATQSSGSSQAAAAPSTLIVDLQGDAATLDPGKQYDTNSYDVYRNIFDNLLQRDPTTGAIGPDIATAWKSASPTEWQFTIRSDVKFSNGDPLTAADAAFSINRILDKTFNSPQYANFSAIKSATAASPTELDIMTSAPYPALLAQLVNLSIVPQKYVQANPGTYFNEHPVGTGPYELAQWVKGDHVTLKANPDYWNGKPYFANVTFRAVPEDATRVADLQSGKAQLALGLTSDDAPAIKSAPNLQLLTGPTERVAYMAFNALGPSPLKDVRLREAIAYAIDTKSLIDNLLSGYGKQVPELLTPLHVGYDPKIPGYPYDPAKAKQLLAAAGDSSGLNLTFTTSPTYDQRIVQAIQGELQQVGVTVKIQSYDFATYLNKVQSPQHNWGDLRFGQWSCACLDADGVIYPLFHTGSIWSSYSDPVFDKAVDAARSTLDPAQRTADYATALEILQKDVPAVALWQVVDLYGAAKQLKWQPTPDEQLFVDHMGWTQ